MGPLPSEDEFPMSALVRLLDERAAFRYDFLLVRLHDKERWCYINFRQKAYVPAFVNEHEQIFSLTFLQLIIYRFHGQSLLRLSNGKLKPDTPLNVRKAGISSCNAPCRFAIGNGKGWMCWDRFSKMEIGLLMNLDSVTDFQRMNPFSSTEQARDVLLRRSNTLLHSARREKYNVV